MKKIILSAAAIIMAMINACRSAMLLQGTNCCTLSDTGLRHASCNLQANDMMYNCWYRQPDSDEISINADEHPRTYCSSTNDRELYNCWYHQPDSIAFPANIGGYPATCEYPADGKETYGDLCRSNSATCIFPSTGIGEHFAARNSPAEGGVYSLRGQPLGFDNVMDRSDSDIFGCEWLKPVIMIEPTNGNKEAPDGRPNSESITLNRPDDGGSLSHTPILRDACTSARAFNHGLISKALRIVERGLQPIMPVIMRIPMVGAEAAQRMVVETPSTADDRNKTCPRETKQLPGRHTILLESSSVQPEECPGGVGVGIVVAITFASLTMGGVSGALATMIYVYKKSNQGGVQHLAYRLSLRDAPEGDA
jgi:hypothetical protein